MVPQDQRWWYIGCAKCKKAPTDTTIPFRCDAGCVCTDTKTLYDSPSLVLSIFEASDLSMAASLHLYCNSSYINLSAATGFHLGPSDDTGEANFFCYDDEARMIIHWNVETLRKLESKNPGFPREINGIYSWKNSRSQLAVIITKDSFYDGNPRTYQVRRIVTDYDLQAVTERYALLAQQGSQASGSGSGAVSASSTPAVAALPHKTESVNELPNPVGSTVR